MGLNVPELPDGTKAFGDAAISWVRPAADLPDCQKGCLCSGEVLVCGCRLRDG
jgi:hypothetical protein